jgi:hypothetical protein
MVFRDDEQRAGRVAVPTASRLSRLRRVNRFSTLLLFATAMALLIPSLGCTALVYFANEEASRPPELPVRDRDDAGVVVVDGGVEDGGSEDGGESDDDAGAPPPDGGSTTTDAGALVLTATTSEGTFALPGTIALAPHVLSAGESVFDITLEASGGGVLVSGATLAARPGFVFNGFTIDEVSPATVDAENPLTLSVRFTAAAFEAHGAALRIDTSFGTFEAPLDVTVSREAFLLGGAGGHRVFGDFSDNGFTDIADLTDVDLSDPQALIHYAVRGVGYGRGTFLAVGTAHVDAGPRARLLMTRDGTTWAECISRFDDDLLDFEPYLVNAESGCTLPNNVPPLEDVAYGNGVFLAVTADGALTSVDGETWTWATETIGTVAPPSGFVPALQQVVFGGGRFVAFGGDRTVTTTDGITWVGETYHAHIVSGVAYGAPAAAAAPLFVAVGHPWVRVASPDGLTWGTPLVEPGTQYDNVTRSVAFVDGRFVAFTNNDAFVSDDGVTWAQQWVRGKQAVCFDHVRASYVTFAFNYDYGVNDWRQRFYRSSTIAELGPANPEPFATRFTPNSIDIMPACGAFFAPLPTFESAP